MSHSSDSKHNHTLELTNHLHDEGIENMAVLIRHGDRYYDRENIQDEAFMPLNEKGKQDAYEFGLQLPKTQNYRFFSSRAGRCIETAYQLEKGCIENGAKTTVNVVAPHLRGFFVLDSKKVVSRLYTAGSMPFIQSWLREEVSEKLMLPPKQAIKEQVDPIMADLNSHDRPCIDICASHDLNVFLIKGFFLERDQEELSKADYLEGVVLFIKDGVLHVAQHIEEQKPAIF